MTTMTMTDEMVNWARMAAERVKDAVAGGHMEKEKALEVFRVLDEMDADVERKKEEYNKSSEEFKKRHEAFVEEMPKRDKSAYVGYAYMMRVGQIKSVRSVLQNEFVEFAKCVKTSKTFALCHYDKDAKEGKRMITVGEFGLGTRWNMKSSPISSYDVDKIAANHKAVIEALRTKKKVMEADAMEKFFANGVATLLAKDDGEIAYEEDVEPFSVLKDTYGGYDTFVAKKLRVAWDSDGNASISIRGEGDAALSLTERYAYRHGGNSFAKELTVPFLVPLMEGFVQRAKEHALKEIAQRETLVSTATAPLMPYLMARRL